MLIFTGTVTFASVCFPKPASRQVPPDTTVYMIVQLPAMFPGGRGAMFQFIQSSAKYRVSLTKGSIVQLKLLVEKDGSISAIKTLYTDADVRFVQEAERIAKAMPRWTPGSQDGQVLRSYAVVPIRFVDAKK
jgi:hypothetical protein